MVVFALAACGGGSSRSGAGTGGVAGTTAQVSGRQVVATETEYKISLSTTHLVPGRTTFVAMNKGHVSHSLEINGPGVSHQRIAGTVSPGSSKRLTVTLQKGSYEIYCPVDGHKNLGMDLHVTVGGASTGSTGGMMHGGTTTTGGSTTTGGGGGY
jgi:uncharacterized cupredoxin-like copper-binding protein